MSKKNFKIHKTGETNNFTLNEAVRQVIGKVASIQNFPLKELTFSHPDMKFLTQNMRLNLLQRIILFNFYTNIIKDDVLIRQRNSEIFSVYFFAGIFILNFLLVYFGIIIYYRSREGYICTYYGFANEQVSQLITRYEKYSEYLQMREVDHKEIWMVSDSEGGDFEERTNQAGGLSLEDYMSQLRSKKRKGSLTAWFGVTHFIATSFLLFLTGLRFNTYYAQNRTIENCVEILHTVDQLALSEVLNYACMTTLEFSMFDFGQLGSGFRHKSLKFYRDWYTNRVATANDLSVKVNLLKKIEQNIKQIKIFQIFRFFINFRNRPMFFTLTGLKTSSELF